MKQSRLRQRLGFALPLLLGTVVCFASGYPTAGATIAFLDAGQDSVLTGLWLRRSDPHRPRAKACWLFYLSTACWKGAAAALMTVGIFVLVLFLVGQDPDMDDFIATMFAMIGGAVASTLMGFVAIYASLRHGVRVWVHPRLRFVLDADLANMANYRRSYYGFNHAVFVVATTLFFPYLAGATGGLIVIAWDPAQMQGVSPAFILSGLFIVGPVALLPVYGWLSSRIIAHSPHDCWPPNVDPIQHADIC